MRYSTLKCIIPVPVSVKENGEKLVFSDLKNFYSSSGKTVAATERLSDFFAFTGNKLEKKTLEEECQIRFCEETSFTSEEWKMLITSKNIQILAGGKEGFSYAVEAFIQMAFAALREGPSTAYFDGGEIADKPRFGYRGFMLDPSRHFQDKATVLKAIELLAAFRINTMHWHLADNQSWRMPSSVVPEIVGKGTLTDGAYTREDIKEIVAFAAKNNIKIIPELDMPGHSGKILSARRQFACDPENPGREYCLGNAESKVFIKKLLDEVMELFPDSPVIHVGGDEAETSAWEKCPKCLAAMKEKGFNNIRELENDFMVDITRYVVSKGRTPMMWGTCSGQVYPSDTIMQAWLDIREPLRIAPNKNKVVYSVHTSLYFDYPANQSEPLESWMFELTEKGVYMTDPYILWEKELSDTILGPEACLWTETLPQWRFIPKFLPRLAAYSECAWSRNERKDYYDFARRKEYLEAAGYYEFLRK
ncbi:MAG: family 20 glycosylhydrolase [Lentisphaeria bacterium]|nr:family 20 glycosylhydrolase [Lentisphaeria bacterium]